MRRRRVAYAVAVGAGVVLALVTQRSMASKGSGFGRGVHIRATVSRPPDGHRYVLPAQVVEQWVSFSPFRWRAEVTELANSQGREAPWPAVPGLPLIFIYDGDRVLLLNQAERKAYVIDASLTRVVESAEHPLLFPEDFALSAFLPRTGQQPRGATGEIALKGDIFSAVVVEKDRVFPADMFSLPPGYALDGTARTMQQIYDDSPLGWPATVYPDGLSFPWPALPDLEAAAKEDPQNADAHYLLGMALFSRHDLKAAKRELETAAALDPSSTAPHNALSVLYEEQGDLVRAVEELQTVVRLDPDDVLAWKALARLYRDMGKTKEAAAAESAANRPRKQ